MPAAPAPTTTASKSTKGKGKAEGGAHDTAPAPPRRARSAQLDRHVDARVLALDQQRDGLRALHCRLELADRLQRLAVDREDQVARLDAGAGRRAPDLLD